MNIFHKVSEKPWLPQADDVSEGQSATHPKVPSERIALRFFLAVVGVVFFLFIITFLNRSQYPDFVALAGQPWQPFTNPSQLWANTLLLFSGSLALHLTGVVTRRNADNTVLFFLALSVFLSYLFILAQLSVWKELMVNGYGLALNPANSFFYLLTGIHGVHLLGGLCVLLSVSYNFWGNKSRTKLRASIALCASYWHFLFVIWLVLFALLTATPETFNTIASVCGF